MIYYKITKEQANTLGEFTYNDVNFNPFVRGQKDGKYIVSDNIYQFLKDTDQFKKIDWKNVETTEKFDDLINILDYEKN